MARLNVARKEVCTHEGGKAKHINPELQLRRSVMACLLWEKQFYEDGQDIASRIIGLVPEVKPQKVAEIAVEARNYMRLRHAPLLIAREMARYKEHKGFVSDVLFNIIQRPDELTEFLAMYWMNGKQSISAQVKKGLARAFTKFDEYQLAKYNRDNAIKLRDVLFLCHAKPKDQDQADMWKRLVDGNLKTPDTWEVALSSGGDKRTHWERLLKENRLGAFALLRNLRNMDTANVDSGLITDALQNIKATKILPFRFIAAARHAPQFEPDLEVGMLKCLGVQEPFEGHTVLLVDVSGSMDYKVSGRSEITRLDAACGVAMLLREVCPKIDIYSFSMQLVRIPARRGFALRDAIVTSQQHSGTPLGIAVQSMYADKNKRFQSARFGWHGSQGINYVGQGLRPDRLIVITDEQSADGVPDPIGKGYMINVASNKNGVGYGAWSHIDGWSEAVVGYIKTFEPFCPNLH